MREAAGCLGEAFARTVLQHQDEATRIGARDAAMSSNALQGRKRRPA
jgi:hypothetical protein